MSVEDEKLNEPNQTENPGDKPEAVVDAEPQQDAAGKAGSGEQAAGQAEEQKDWRAEAEILAKQVAELKDAALRAQAEAQNVRRRAEMDVEKAHKFALEKFAKELVPVIDSLEKAIEAEKALGNEMTPLQEGVEMTLSMFLSGVKKFNLEQVDPVGQPFDPALHEAMSLVEAPDAEPNTVIAAMQKGYTLSGRLIRPAMVMVAKNSAASAGKVDEQA